MIRRTAVALVALLLVGCSSPTEPTEPTVVPETTTPAVEPAETTTEPAEPTPEPTETTEPTEPVVETTHADGPTDGPTLVGDEAERYGLVAPSFHAYWDVLNETYAAGGAEEATEDMLRTMTGGQLDYWVEVFSRWKSEGNRYEGVNRVLYATPKQVSLSADGGVAEVEFCVDMTATRAFNADGDPLNKDGRYQSGVAVLQWIDGTWKVAGHREGTANKDAC